MLEAAGAVKCSNTLVHVLGQRSASSGKARQRRHHIKQLTHAADNAARQLLKPPKSPMNGIKR
eukprot:15478799-Alexandrium_andersonii.AAC.1